MSHDPSRRLLALCMVLLGGLGLAACNTMKGAGQDVEAAGEQMSDTAEDAQDSM